MQPDQITQIVGGQGTPSPLSPTPSPAGSVGSVGSQSSGYGSGELAGVRGGSGNSASSATIPQQPPAASMGPCMPMPVPIHLAVQKEHTQFGYILSSIELWDQADQLVERGKHTGEFF